MTANIAMINDKAAYAGRKSAWHKLGISTGHAMTWSEAIKLAQLDWEVAKVQMTNPLMPGNPIDGSPAELIDAYGIFRLSDNHFLGSCGPNFTPIQNLKQFEFVDTIMEARDGAHYETAGALDDGRKVFCLANINNDFEVVPGDRHETYLLFINSHEQGYAGKVYVTTVRVVCQNTLDASLVKDGKDNNDCVIKFNHNKNIDAKMTQAHKLIRGGILTAKDIQDKLRELAERVIQPDHLTAIINRLYPVTASDGKERERQIAKGEKMLMAMLERVEDNDGGKFPEIKNTAYALYNATTEITDHFSPVRKVDSRKGMSDEHIRALNATVGNGNGAEFKQKALDVILTATEYAQRRAHTVYSLGSAGMATDTASNVVIELEEPETASHAVQVSRENPVFNPGADLLNNILENGLIATDN